MTTIEAVSIIVASLVVPYIVALIRNGAIKGRVVQWLAIGIACVAGVAAGFVGGIPATPQAWVGCIGLTIGGVQVAYTAFRSVGITSKALDALMEVGTTPKTSIATGEPTHKIGGTDD